MERILIPLDFSEVSNNALEYGIQLAKRIKGRITLLHTLHFPSADPLAPAYNTSTKVQASEAEEAVQSDMEQLTQDIQNSHDEIDSVDYVVPVGFPGDEILRVLKESSHDLVIMGTKGESNYPDSIMGTTASNVLQKSPVSVLLIPEDSKFKPFEKVLYATDYHEGDIKAIKDLMELADQFGAKVHALHDVRGDENQEGSTSLKKALEKEGLGEKINFETIDEKNVEEGINTYIEKNGIDLLALLNEERNFFQRLLHPSFSRKMAFHSRIPLMVYHPSRD